MSEAAPTRAAQVAVAATTRLDPASIQKYVTPLVIPPAMPPTGRDYYEIAVRQFTQQILLAGMPATTVWGYGSVNHAGSCNYPAFTIETRHGCRVKVRWINDLVDEEGRFLPHLLPVDQTLHWANPPGGRPGVTRTAATRRRTPDRCRSSPTSTATTRSTTATATRRRGSCPAPPTSRPDTRRPERSTSSSGRARPTGRNGARATRSSTTRTTSAPGRSGTTTTRSA